MNLGCHACGATFRTAIAEARHRHNFPTLCKRNKRFARFVARNEAERVRQERPLLEVWEVCCPTCGAGPNRNCMEVPPEGLPRFDRLAGPHEERLALALQHPRGQSVEEAEISGRLRNVLERAWVGWMSTALLLSDAQLLLLPGMGRTSLAELRTYQRRHRP